MLLFWWNVQGALKEDLGCHCWTEELFAFAKHGARIPIAHDDLGFDAPYKRYSHSGLGCDDARATHYGADDGITRGERPARR